MEGLYLPLVTPFHDGHVDLESLRGLVKHYSSTGVAGLIMLGTTGESPTVDPDEQRMIVETTLEAVGGALPVYVGVSGNATRQVARGIAAFESTDVAGYLVATPYYNRPSADGMVAHYQSLAEETGRTIIVYNVPYRTGINLPNDSLFEIVATTRNVRAVKDSTGNIVQSLDLLERAPAELSVLTGEDPLYFTSLANGAAGGILAASHLAVETFVAVTEAMARQELVQAREAWRRVSRMIPKLFGEANPMPLKYALWRQGLLRSPECRLPLTRVSDGLAATLDEIVAALPRV
jgi:4-hydroxy-tetrahydrodipicolinate synthase